MRAFLAICAVALTACAAEPEAEAQINNPRSMNTHVPINKIDPEVRRREATLRTALASLQSNSDASTMKDAMDVLKQSYSWANLTDEETLLRDELVKFHPRYLSDEEHDLKVVRISESQLDCHGIAKQGGLVVCHTAPNTRVEVGRTEKDTYTQTADKDGVLIVGFDRDEPAAFVRVGDARVDFDITPREYDTSRIDGLPKKFVSEYTADQLKQIRAASAHKKIGFASKVEEVGFKDGFIYPVTTHTKTTNFGAQRILNGDPKRPHFGVDLAAPKGTPILAPADGIVSLASEEMYFEGSLIMIDHGQGLISYYLHNEDVMVEEGQRVVQGEQIGTVGSRGRSTGPHLCWRLKWRGRNLDPELLTEWPQRG